MKKNEKNNNTNNLFHNSTLNLRADIKELLVNISILEYKLEKIRIFTLECEKTLMEINENIYARNNSFARKDK